MNATLISYDPEKLGSNYAELIESIQNLGPWWHCFESVTIVKTDLTSEKIRDILKPCMNGGRFLVADLANHVAWDGFTAECSAWLSDNV